MAYSYHLIYICIVIINSYRKYNHKQAQKQSKMTLKEIYSQVKQEPKPDAPATAFVRELAAVAKKSEIAVRRWLSGTVEPDALTKSVLAKHFNTTPEELFPSHN